MKAEKPKIIDLLKEKNAEIERLEHNWCVLMKKIAEKDKEKKELRDRLAKMIIEKDREIEKEQMEVADRDAKINQIMNECRKLFIEKDKEIEKLKASNSIYKALNERLKKENEETFADIIHEGHIKGIINRQVNQALSELRDEIEKLAYTVEEGGYGIEIVPLEKVLIAINSRRTV